MTPNMNRPQRKAITIQTSSTLSIGSFHQIRCSGGVTAMSISPSQKDSRLSAGGCNLQSSFRQGDRGDFHYAPDQIENRRKRYAEEQQQEWIVENPLHHRHALGARKLFGRRHGGTPRTFQ